jgi:branched-chain amino acid transport system substrate-binding protein
VSGLCDTALLGRSDSDVLRGYRDTIAKGENVARHVGKIAVLLVSLGLVAACGTRLPDSAFVSSGGGQTDGALSPAPGDDRQPGDDATDTTLAGGDASGDPIDGGGSSPNDTTATGDGGGGGDDGSTGSSDTTPSGSGDGGNTSSGPNEASDVGVTATEIKIGNITAVTGGLGDAFAPSQRGLQTFVSYINAKGGVNGRKITLIVCDDKEDRTRALACARKLIEQDKVFALIANNTRAMGGAATYINDKAVPDFFGIPITMAYYRFPHLWEEYGNGYERDGKTVGYKGMFMQQTTLYRWFRLNLNLKKAAVFYYDPPAESKQAGDFIKKGLELEGYQVTAYPLNFANPNFDQPVLQMQRNGTEIVFDAIDDGANRKMCDSFARYGYQPKAKVSTIVAYGDSVGTDFAEICRDVYYIGGNTRTYADTSFPGVKLFRDAFARYKPGVEVHQWALEGWLSGQGFAEAVESMGAKPTRKGLEDWLRGLKGYTHNGMQTAFDYQPIDYSQPTLPDCITIAQWQDSQKGWVQRAGPDTCYPDAKNYPTTPAEQGD